jgi:TPR repeat protein
MSRAFTSEEYEQKEVPIVIPPKIEEAPDHDIVMKYSNGRSLEDPKLPYEIGMGFLKGKGEFFQSDELGIKWLERSVKMGYAPAMVSLAELFLKDTKTYGFRRPAKLLKQASDLGSADAKSYIDMSSVDDPSTKKAYTVYRLNGELGDISACLALADGFEKGYYGKDKTRAAATWYIRAFKLGDEGASKKALALHYKKKVVLTEDELALLRKQ